MNQKEKPHRNKPEKKFLNKKKLVDRSEEENLGLIEPPKENGKLLKLSMPEKFMKGKLSEEEIKNLDIHSLLDYIKKGLYHEDGIQPKYTHFHGTIEEFVQKGYITVKKDSKQIKFSESYSRTYDVITAIEVLEEKKIENYFKHWYKEILDYNRLPYLYKQC